ncbi:hypothetical protein A2U01_0006495, partial [Trifolium medium]|nr:hypothetical protein [Trifolium medium]
IPQGVRNYYSTIDWSTCQTVVTDPQKAPTSEPTNAAETLRNYEQQIPQEPPLVEVQSDDLNDQVLEGVNDVANNNDIEVEGEDNQQLEGEHSTTNNHQKQQHLEGNDERTMDTDEFMNSSAGYERTARTGDSNEDEGISVSKPIPSICLPSEVLQSLKDLPPEEALNKLLSSHGAYIPTAADRERAL